MDKVFHAKYNAKTNDISLLKPLEGENFFFEDELANIETELADALAEAMQSATDVHMDKTLQQDQSSETDLTSAY